MSKKKPSYKISKSLDDYLISYSRKIIIPIFYEDLKRFSGSVSVFNNKERDTLWVRVFYSDSERKEIDEKKLKTLIEIDGGINFENAKLAKKAGIDILVSGTTIFKENSGNLKKNIQLLRSE